MRQLDPAAGYSVDLGSNIDVPQLTPLGYDVARQLVGGRTVAANATETRTFTLAMTAREAAITHLGAVVDFNGVFGPAPTTPVTASNITCAGPGKWEPYLQAQVASPAVHWQVGENSAPETVVVDTTYTLTCTVTLTNTWSSPVSYMPAMLTEGQIHYLSAPGSNPQTVSSNLAEAGPVDPLGNVTYSTTTPANAFIDKRFQRSVIFDGENRAMDIVPPAVTLSAPASAAEGTPVTILASAVDQSAVTYT